MVINWVIFSATKQLIKPTYNKYNPKPQNLYLFSGENNWNEKEISEKCIAMLQGFIPDFIFSRIFPRTKRREKEVTLAGEKEVSGV